MPPASNSGGYLDLGFPVLCYAKPAADAIATTFLPSQGVTYSADGVVALTDTVTDEFDGIIAVDSNYTNSTTFATTSDTVIGFMLPQCQPMYVLATAASAFTGGATVYSGQTADDAGNANSSSANSATKVGTYHWNNNGDYKDFTVGAATDKVGILFKGAAW